MLKDPNEWEEYHRQYREARKVWPVIPYEEIINRIKQLSPRLLIGDFGCGEAKLLEQFGDNRVFSFDHVAVNNKVKACDMKSVPLPDEAIDIAVFSLSLMGKNWAEYIDFTKLLSVAAVISSFCTLSFSNCKKLIMHVVAQFVSDFPFSAKRLNRSSIPE